MVSYIRSDLEFILKQIKISEDHALYVESNGTQGAPLFGESENANPASIPSYNISWGLRTVDGSYNHLLPGQEQWGASDRPFNELMEPDYRTVTVMMDPDGPGPAPMMAVDMPYTPGNDVDGPGTFANPGDVIDPTVRTISNLLVDQTLGNPAAILSALERAGVDDPGLVFTAQISAAYTPLKDEFQAVAEAERVQAAAAAAADANPGNAGLQAAAIAAQLALDAARGVLDAAAGVSGGLNELLAAHGIEMDGANLHLPNTAPDEGLSAPFNSWFTLFGQFFDHGLDLVNKGDSGTVMIPLMPDDPLYVEGSNTNFMVLTRATVGAGVDGEWGTADDVRPLNTTTAYVDQNQTYTSHASHQVFVRQYVLNEAGDPVATGNLIEGANGGMATWGEVKAQAAQLLGIDLTDADVGKVPLLRTDPYGNFIPGTNGLPQLIIGVGLDGVPNTGDDVVVEGNLANPVDPSNVFGAVDPLLAVGAIRTNHAFLADIAHGAAPDGLADGDTEIGGNLPEDGVYDNELLDAHFIAGDGRVNENIGLTAVHHVFHAEHNRLVEHTKDTLLADAEQMLLDGASQADAVAFLNEWLVDDVTTVPTVPADVTSLVWDGGRLFQAAKFGTEMQYQHLVFEEFARKVQPTINTFLVPDGFDTTIDPSIVAEFAHVVYRFGHSMLTESIDRYDQEFNADHISLIQGFLNPTAFNGPGGTIDDDVAAGSIIRGMTRQVGNEIDEFVTSALRNNLLGLPLDLATINLARGRDTGVPSLNEARRTFYEATNQDERLRPYESWVDYAGHLKHEASIINFIAAYGTHALITGADTIQEKRDAALTLITGVSVGGQVVPADAVDFLNGTGAYATDLGGLENIDLWIGGLAEEIMPFGGMLGSTFNFVFEVQMEMLQSGDRFYYLQRLDGLHLFGEMENNSFAAMIMRNTDATHLPSDVFSTPGLILEVDQTRQFNTGTGVPDPLAPGQTWTPSNAAALAALAAREDGSPLVDDVFYNLLNPDVAAAGVDPDVHYALFGRHEGRQANLFFDAAYYAAQNPDVAADAYYGDNLLEHYITFGGAEGRSPSAQFDGARYLAENPDVAAAGMNPLAHFLQYGRYEGRQYYPIGNAPGQTWTNPSIAAALAALSALEDGSPLVDDVFYKLLYSDVAAAGVDPDVHYALFGQQEGRQANQFSADPSQFDGARYLAENPDVLAAGMNPLAHFLQFGRYEGRQYYGPAEPGVEDTNADPVGGGLLTQLVIRDNPATVGTDDNYLRYTGGDHVVLGGTDVDDIIIAGIGDDTLYGDDGNDKLEGGFGNDIINGGDGDDIITDAGGDDNIKAGAGNDVVHAGPGLDLVLGGAGQDFIFLGTDEGSEVFAGTGNDFIYGNRNAERILGNEGNDWIETGTFDGAPGDNFDEIFSHDTIDGHDVFIGDGGFDEFIGEGGDDIMVGSTGRGKMVGMSGFDWATYKNSAVGSVGVVADLSIPIIFDEAPTIPANSALDEYQSMEGLSGSSGNDTLRGSNILADERLPFDPITNPSPLEGYQGSALDAAGIDLITGLQDVLGAGVTDYSAGDIILGGDGNDVIAGQAGDDIIDGDKWLNVRISVRENSDGTGDEIFTADSMTELAAQMFDGTYNPGQLQIVREILTADGVGDVDTAVFSGELDEYDITFNAADGTTIVEHTGAPAIDDGTDTLSNIEQLQFSGGVIVATGNSNLMLGLGNSDVFTFLSSADADGDTIIGGFQPGDRIDLSAIDANSTIANNNAFTLLPPGGVFTAVGQLSVTFDGANTVIAGNTDGDATTAEFNITIRGTHTLTNNDFDL